MPAASTSSRAPRSISRTGRWRFATGRHMCTGLHPRALRGRPCRLDGPRPVSPTRVQFHDGEGQVAPGVTVHRVGGHSDGLQVVRVETARGPVVIASDAMHFYANGSTGNPFPIIFDLGAVAPGWRIAQEAGRRRRGPRVIPGHDPAECSRTASSRCPGRMARSWRCTCRRWGDGKQGRGEGILPGPLVSSHPPRRHAATGVRRVRWPPDPARDDGRPHPLRFQP